MFDPVELERRAGERAHPAAHAWPEFDPAAGMEAFAEAWLATQCGSLAGCGGAVLVMGPPDTGPFAPLAFWPEGGQASELLADVAEAALSARAPALRHGEVHSALAVPVLVGGHLHGLVALETLHRGDADLRAGLAQVQAGVQGVAAALLQEQAAREQEAQGRMMATLDLIASTMTEGRFVDAARTLATDLAQRLDADRVSIGFRVGETVRVEAMSHSARLSKGMDLVRAIGSAMDEAIDQKSSLLVPPPARQLLVTRDHAALARMHGNDCILTIPFVTNDWQAGAFTFERPASRPFSSDEIALAQAVTALCSRILQAQRLNDRPLAARVKDQLRADLAKYTGPLHMKRKLAACMLLFSVVFFSVADGEYVVGANASLEGMIRRQLVAPFDGYVESSAHRAGDTVRVGQVLATLDQRDLQLEYLRWSSQGEQYAAQYQEALAKSDRVQGSITLAQLNQAKAQMQLLAEQLARASIKSPFDGIVVSGDLSQSLGSTVKRGQPLFEVAPLGGYRMVLEVDESDIADVRVGQHGQLMLAALPGRAFPLTVTHITPVSVSRDGKTFFRVEAGVGQADPKLRPGLEGVGRITLGERKLIWLWTHRLLDWVRLAVWSWV